MADIFLSRSSRDKAQVRRVRDDLVGQGFSVCLDLDVLPTVRPQDVTGDTAEALRVAMRACHSLVYVITAQSGTSRWMPWELGYFDGFRGRVFIYPLDDAAEQHAQGMEYLRIYPKVPLAGRRAFLQRHVPRSAPPEAEAEAPLVRPPMFDYADQQATMDYGRQLQQGMAGAAVDPTALMAMWSDIGTAWLRLWGLTPPAERPGLQEGPWRAKP